MPTTVQYQKYKLSKANGKEILESEFSDNFGVPSEHVLQVARDLANFSNNIKDSLDYKSTLWVKTSDDLLTIERDYKLGTSTLISDRQTDPNFFWLPDEIAEHTVGDKNPYVLFPLKETELLESIARILPSLKKFDVNGDKLRNESEIAEELKGLGGDKFTELHEKEKEIEIIEQDLETQRQVDKAQLSVSDLEGSLAEILDTLKSVEDLVDAQKGVYSKLKQYSKQVGDDVVSQAEQMRSHMQEIREQKLKYESELLKKGKPSSESKQDESNSRPKLAKFLLFLPTILILISVGGFIITNNLYILALGIIGGILEALLYLALNVMEPSIDLTAVDVSKLHHDNRVINPDLEISADKSSEITKFFIDKAWMTVLKQEFTELQSAIDRQLEGQKFADIHNIKLEITAELDKVKSLIADHEGKDIPPEDYLRFRRKLDMLKVEKSKIEKDIAELPDQDKLQKLQTELKIVKKLPKDEDGTLKISTLPNGFIGSVSNKYIGVQGGGESELEFLDIQTGSWVKSELDQTELLGIYTYLNLLKWSSNPSLPVMLVGVVSKLSQTAKALITDQVNELKELGQVIVISSE